MKREIDVLVIGGGVVGVCAAYYLGRQGRRVTLVEKGEICAGSSYGNAGLVVPSHSVPLAA
ncbi:MAG: FAD-dependent oxidoreductase, partial [Candidatus Latescibacteria bacterium]|nr:FAD-dependent oxidoreductase [Candidatus Latescibacterota bacterium]